MNWQKLNPWNWFKHEDDADREAVSLPVQQSTPSAGQALDPFAHAWASWQRQFDQMLQHSFRTLAGLPGRTDGFRPSLDLADEGDHYRISLETPGMAADDLAIRVDGDRLIVEGEKQQVQPAGETAYYRVERYYGAFRRILALPADADAEHIDASLRDGVLTLNIPRQKGATPPRQIPIRT
ncbi:MAG: Hsp20/alpha crystallin family protein [Pseudomonadales bacterium]|nr:Hsp20/alpha crystallin family protein [Pseudomonadales bacterium]